MKSVWLPGAEESVVSVIRNSTAVCLESTTNSTEGALTHCIRV